MPSLLPSCDLSVTVFPFFWAQSLLLGGPAKTPPPQGPWTIQGEAQTFSRMFFPDSFPCLLPTTRGYSPLSYSTTSLKQEGKGDRAEGGSALRSNNLACLGLWPICPAFPYWKGWGTGQQRQVEKLGWSWVKTSLPFCSSMVFQQAKKQTFPVPFSLCCLPSPICTT
jgi:hypothetical protein